MKQAVHESEWNQRTTVNVILCLHIIVMLFSSSLSLCRIGMLQLRPPVPTVMLDTIGLE
jgi:hypothetical protein